MNSNPLVVTVVVQARFASTRLPGKALLKIGNLPSLSHVLLRSLRIPGATHFMLATTRARSDNPLASLAKSLGYKVFRGATHDVVSRIHRAARINGSDYIVRVTGDCPIFDPSIAGEVLERALDERADFALNYSPPTFPDGLDVAVLSQGALSRLARESLNRHDREHVTTALERGDVGLKTVRVVSPTGLAHHRWTLDNRKDLEFFRKLNALCDRPLVQMSSEEILNVLGNHPNITRINANYSRNYGHDRPQF